MTMINLRTATSSDLPSINQVIEAAVMGWKLPERVKRLSLTSYFYNEVDLKHLDVIVAEQHGKVIALASWEPANTKNTPGHENSLLLYGLYVHPQVQKQGIATRLLSRVEKAVQDNGMKGILVKAQEDAVGFFTSQGFIPVRITSASSDYANLLWKLVDFQQA